MNDYFHVDLATQTIEQNEKRLPKRMSDCPFGSSVIPESRELQPWILQGSREQHYTRVTRVVVTQIQLSQMAGVTVQSRGQGSTALLCDQTASQAADTGASIQGYITGFCFTAL